MLMTKRSPTSFHMETTIRLSVVAAEMHWERSPETITHLLKTLTEGGSSFTATADGVNVLGVKETHCSVALDYDASLFSQEECPRTPATKIYVRTVITQIIIESVII